VIKYILQRVALVFLTLFIILTIVFVLLRMLPFPMPVGTPDTLFGFFRHEVVLGNVIQFHEIQLNRAGDPITPLFRFVDHQGVPFYFYRTPISTQYFSFLRNVFTRWDWGVSTSIHLNESAFRIIRSRLPVTIRINAISFVLAVPFGLFLGVVAALKKNKKTDHFISTMSAVLIAVPGFILMIMLLLIFAYGWRIFPTQFPVPTDPLSRRLLGYVLPVFAASLGTIAAYSRFTRAELCEVIASDYLLLARTKGLTKRQAIIRHAFKSAFVPILPVILGGVISMIGGNMIIELIYGIHGVGSLFIDAFNFQDFNVLLVTMAFFTFIGLMAGILTDISYGFIDPRVRMGGAKR